MTRRHLTASLIVIVFTAALVIAAVIWSARTTPQRLGVEVRAFSRPATATTTGPDLPARAARDRRLFEEWVRAVAERTHRQRVEFFRAARTLHDQPFLVCVRAHESDTAGGYQATDHGHGGIENMGAYQFDQPTWNSAARHAGAPHLVDVRPTNVNGFDQDRVAWAWYLHVGPSPWAGSGCS